MSAPIHTGDVRHTDPGVRAALSAYVAALRDARSVLVRPREAFEGLDRVTAAVGRLAADALLVTDLHESSTQVTVDSSGSEAILAYHTSGSTGSPKCVVYRHDQVRSHAAAVAEVLGLSSGSGSAGELMWAALPPTRFAYGLSIVNCHALTGVPVTFTDADWGLPGLADALAADDRPLAIYALPQHTPLLLASDIPGERLARLLIAGGRLSGASASALAKRFPAMRLTNMYGQAEMGPRLATWEGAAAEFTEGLIGTPIPGVTLADADGSRVGTGDGGRPGDSGGQPGDSGGEPRDSGGEPRDSGGIAARSEHAMTYCLRAPYTAVEQFAGRTELVPTGDLGARITHGPHAGLWHHDGRADHVINVAGTKVDARRVAAIVQECARPLLIGVGTRPGRLGGDAVPVVELVPDGDAPRGTAPIRRALHGEFGSLAALFDIRYVDRLTAKESGK